MDFKESKFSSILSAPLCFESMPWTRAASSRTGWYQAVKEGRAPKPIKFGRSSRWLKHEVDDYIRSLAFQRDQSAR
jgi:predicted DNA-binding transcriptional regulator AlpA